MGLKFYNYLNGLVLSHATTNDKKWDPGLLYSTSLILITGALISNKNYTRNMSLFTELETLDPDILRCSISELKA